MASLKLNQRWTWIIASVAMLGGGLVLTFLLVLATQNSDQLEPYLQVCLRMIDTDPALAGSARSIRVRFSDAKETRG